MKKLVLMIALAASTAATAQTPRVLYDNDVETYAKVFEIQDKGAFAAADKEIKNISNDILMGYVLHQRYMSPYYATRFSEARDWLKKYSDLPVANDIYNLGLRKGAKKDLKKPKRESSPTSYFPNDNAKLYQMIQYGYGHLGKAAAQDVKTLLRRFNRAIRKTDTKSARNAMEHPSAKRFIARADYLRMEAFLAFAFFLNDDDDDAILWAAEPSEELDFYIANWVLGLVHWRQKNYEKSRDHFRRVATEKYLPADNISAGAYWAWRANERIEDKDARADGEELLDIAASYPKTFYGILAQKTLNKKFNINWDEPRFTLENAREIISWSGGVRALALLQLDKKQLAANELKHLLATVSDAGDGLVNAVLAVAEIANMPFLSINVANYIKEYSEANRFAAPAYPILDIDPDDGWKIDPALINAVIRQESRFNPRAKSYVGARGLLQIMPSTASFIAKDSSLRKKKRDKLYDAATNLNIGQMYIDYLLNLPEIDGNLFKFLLAYNAGPGNLKRQLAKTDGGENDPLFFVESVRFKETRIYIKRVMANLWIYKNRLYQKDEFLEEIERGEWPVYTSDTHNFKRLTSDEMHELEQYLDKKSGEEAEAEEGPDELSQAGIAARPENPRE
ncbi:MAG: lytic transglycosylase domain-containing protein [Rickettsiales bacterium]|nr:lytic transglycosylase domain-containing protein [Rickettsiales bacterium]